MALFRLITILSVMLILAGCLSLGSEISGDDIPDVVEKELVVVTAPDGVTLKGKLYPFGTVLEIIADDGRQFSAVGWKWETVYFPKSRIAGGEFKYGTIPWDQANNRVSFRDSPKASWLVRYFHWVQLFLARAWPFGLTFTLLSVCLFVAALNAKDFDATLEIFFSLLGVLFFLLLAGSCQGNNYYGADYIDSSQANQLSTGGGRLYPLSSSAALHITHTIWYDLGLVVWIPAFAALHLFLAILAPLFVGRVTRICWRMLVPEDSMEALQARFNHLKVLGVAERDDFEESMISEECMKLLGLTEKVLAERDKLEAGAEDYEIVVEVMTLVGRYVDEGQKTQERVSKIRGLLWRATSK